MTNLVGYGSSDSEEDNDATSNNNRVDTNRITKITSAQQQLPLHGEKQASHRANNEQLNNKTSNNSRSKVAVEQQHISTRSNEPDRPGVLEESNVVAATATDDNNQIAAKSTPYRNSPDADLSASEPPSLHQLTMPPVPNLDIPPSPPGSPAVETSTKVSHFLDLKRRGVHFHTKLAASSALRNPALLSTLAERAGMLPEELYETSLPSELWYPNGFPDWAFKEQLAIAQRERGKGKGVEFVKSSLEGGDK